MIAICTAATGMVGEYPVIRPLKNRPFPGWVDIERPSTAFIYAAHPVIRAVILPGAGGTMRRCHRRVSGHQAWWKPLDFQKNIWKDLDEKLECWRYWSGGVMGPNPNTPILRHSNYVGRPYELGGKVAIAREERGTLAQPIVAGLRRRALRLSSQTFRRRKYRQEELPRRAASHSSEGRCLPGRRYRANGVRRCRPRSNRYSR